MYGGDLPSESLGEMLNRNASHQEPIEADTLLGPLTRFGRRCESLLEFPDHVGREGETEAEEGLVELFSVD
jgi:hypothetical protein